MEDTSEAREEFNKRQELIRNSQKTETTSTVDVVNNAPETEHSTENATSTITQQTPVETTNIGAQSEIPTQSQIPEEKPAI